MRVWRLSAERWAPDPLSGRGAELHGGRWNPKGLPCVYLSSSVALATLELLVHLDGRAPDEPFLAVEVEIPDELVGPPLPIESLPTEWRQFPSPAALAKLGGDWLTQLSSLVLAVPSVVVPSELNYLLNPRHPAAERVSVAGTSPFEFDPRLFPDRPANR